MSGIFANKIIQIAIAILIPFAAMLMNFLIRSVSEVHPWFDQLNKPLWNPPKWIFQPVWTLLLISMGYASFRVWDKGDGFSGKAKNVLILYAINLIVNTTWSLTFFKFHLLGWSVVHVVILLVIILITSVMFYRIDKFAGLLYLPYLAWVSFATVLLVKIWKMNTTSS